MGIFDQKQDILSVYMTDTANPITIAAGWPSPTCGDCEKPGILPVYSDKLAIPDTVPQQLVEFSFGLPGLNLLTKAASSGRAIWRAYVCEA
jgi:hypothetical protein